MERGVVLEDCTSWTLDELCCMGVEVLEVWPRVIGVVAEVYRV